MWKDISTTCSHTYQPKFKHESIRIQHEINVEIIEGLGRHLKYNTDSSVSVNLVELIMKVNEKTRIFMLLIDTLGASLL